MNFTYPWVFLLIPVYLALEAFLFFRFKHASLSLATIAFLKPASTWRTRVMRWLRFAPLFVVVLLAFALAGPESVVVRDEILPSGVKIIIGLDISGSMAAEDFQPVNRLAVAKKLLKDFVRGRTSDQIGLILFSGKAVTRAPLSLDHEPLIRTLETVDLGTLPEGTAIGTAIISAVNRLQKYDEPAGQKKGDQILVLITDGRNNAGEIHPLDALQIAVRHNLKIYAIGVGTYGSVPFPVMGPDGKKRYRYEKADLDEALLREIAEKSSGKYFRAVDAEALKRLFDTINRLEKSEPTTVQTTRIEDRAPYFGYPALFLALLYCTFTTIIVRYP